MMSDMEQRKICIVNGDDFGASAGINRGFVEAHTQGILTSASLMINMPGAAEAIELSAAYPDLGVGLHVNFTNEGNPVIDITDIGAAKAELYGQYELFLDRMGRPPTHIDSHHNVHRMPELLPLFMDLAEENGLFLRDYSSVRCFGNFYGQWDGESHPEHINSEQLAHMLETEIMPGFTELACHPGYMGEDFQSEYGIEREFELQSLCSALARQRVAQLNIELMNYSQVRQLMSSMTPGPSAL
jgi:predicted glycoside hydrolase/deacetylase ChbG (UPF0249 family)